MGRPDFALVGEGKPRGPSPAASGDDRWSGPFQGKRSAQDGCPEARGIVTGILRSSNPGLVEDWIDDAIETELVELVRFAQILHRDLDAVKNAAEFPWSNGQAEGQINRLKTLKRAKYGRTGPELMHVRMLPFNHTL